MADKAPSKDMSHPSFWNSQIHVSNILNPEDAPSNQFHFNTNSLNNFLVRQAKAAHINIIDDEITDVELNSCGEIDILTGTSGNKYNYDFYVDCTGFKRLLISKLGAKWKSYSKYLKINAAIAFPTEDPDEYNAWTLTRAMDYGWMWHIPVWGRAGNGYVYDSSYITADQAKEEVERVLGRKIEVARSFSFDPGSVDRFWIKNCVALGLSSSFIEPLEASSIGSTIQQAFLLMHAVSNYNEHVVEKYNEQNTQLLDNICDYVRLHYQTEKTNTSFWTDARNMPMSPFLETKLKHWKTHIPSDNDFDHVTPYIMFKAVNFAMVIQGLGLYDPAAYKTQYMQLSSFIKNSELDHFNNYVSERKIAVPHKEAIRMIREVA
jgi:tryptophan halogenase